MGALIWIIIGISFIAIIFSFGSSNQKIELATKFKDLGTLQGRTKDEIINVVGPPNSISQINVSDSLLQWIIPGYHICLLFDLDNICKGVTHESLT